MFDFVFVNDFFNLIEPINFSLRSPYVRDYTSIEQFSDIAVDWDPMSGYPKRLPSRYYPRPGLVLGVLWDFKLFSMVMWMIITVLRPVDLDLKLVI